MNLTDKRKKQTIQGQFGRVSDPGSVQLHSNGSQRAAELHTGSQNQSAADQAVQMVQSQPNGGYQSQWQDQMNGVMQQILDRKPFNYDMNADALYQQYKDQYTTQGRLAMQDTMGQAAKLTGGYGNSHAQTAGQQVYQGYMQQLNDKIPELYNLALSKYQMEGQDLMDRFSMLGAMEDRDYGRYQDDRNWEYQTGRDQLSDQRYDQEWQYQQDRDALADQRYDQEWEYQQGRDELEDQRYQDELAYGRGQDAYAQLMQLITTTGYKPTAEELAAAGMTEEQAKAWLRYYEGTVRSSGGGGGNPKPAPKPIEETEEDSVGQGDSLTDLLDDIMATGTLLNGSRVDPNTRAGQRAIQNAINMILADAEQSGEITPAEADRLRQIYGSP